MTASTLPKLSACNRKINTVKGLEVLSHANVSNLVPLKTLSFTLQMTDSLSVLRKKDALVTSHFFVA
jgi:hypothetical protein